MAINKYYEDGKLYYRVYVNGWDSRGNRFQKTKTKIDSHPKAVKVEFEFKRDLAQKKEEDVPFRWHEWFSHCMRQMKIEMKPSTIYNYETQIRKWVAPHWDQKEINSITKFNVHEMIFEHCSAMRSPQNKKTVLKMLKRLFAMAVEEGKIDRNPCHGIQVKAPEVEQKVLTTSEVEIFLREAKICNHRFYPIWAMALMTGMRSGELFALRWTDVDLEGRKISVSRQWTNKNGIGPTKTQRSRVVPVSDALVQFLRELKLKHGAERESVLPHLPEWEGGAQAAVTREFCAMIGVTQIKFHDLRATFITSLLSRGESLARVMSMVGHGQLKTTNGYLRKAGVDVQGGTDKLGYKLPELANGRILSIVKELT
ncbi:MAG: site-specific integrase [Xanthomonadaceae bacterium]|nr:site-specific integrase [Xanthomonadaceae bacterium]